MDFGHRVVVFSIVGGIALSIVAATHGVVSRYMLSEKIRHPTPLADMAEAIKDAEESRRKRHLENLESKEMAEAQTQT